MDFEVVDPDFNTSEMQDYSFIYFNLIHFQSIFNSFMINF